jgi:nicotinate dehydrogenase subunit A
MSPCILHINRSDKVIDSESDTPLLYELRDDLQLNRPKFG